MRASATINTTRKDGILGVLPVKHNVRVENSTVRDTLRSLAEQIILHMDKMPDDQLENWTDIQISLNRS